jgi:hypothetical protein
VTGPTLVLEPSRHRQFDVARRRADWTVEQLWIHYLALGGTLLVFDLEAYLCGLAPLPAGQQDVMAVALNERLADLHEVARLPYLTVQLADPSAPGPLDVLDERPPAGHPANDAP